MDCDASVANLSSGVKINISKSFEITFNGRCKLVNDFCPKSILAEMEDLSDRNYESYYPFDEEVL